MGVADLQWAVQEGAEMSQEQYAAMTPEQQAAYWAQWQYYAQYYSAPDPSSAQQYSAGQYPPYQASQLPASVRALRRRGHECIMNKSALTGINMWYHLNAAECITSLKDC